MINHPDLVKDWKTACDKTDECSTGILKPLTRWFLNLIGRSRNYGCGCVQHDFDYRFGPKYGITKDMSDCDLRDYIIASGHPKIAKTVYYVLKMCGWKAWNGYRKK